MPEDTVRTDMKQQLARALRRWESEGGSIEDDGLAAPESSVLKCLGAAVVMAWNDLPMPVQRALFRHAAAVNESYDTSELKTQIARFLHLHKDDDPQSGP